MPTSSADANVLTARTGAAGLSDQAVLRALFAAALDAAGPEGKFAGKLPPRPAGRALVLGAGKAAARMAAAFEAAWNAPCEGLVVTRYGHSCSTRFIEVVEAAHPVPDDAGVAATRRILELAESAGPDDLVVALISGGASALLTLPIDGIALADKQALTRSLLRSGAPIAAMNRVRKALSAVKGGKLAAAAAPARLVTYIISDVPGDDPATVGSGPTVPDVGSSREALAILDQYAIDVPSHVRATLARAPSVAPAFAQGPHHMIASPQLALEAAARRARELGLEPVLLGDAIEGEAREVATVMAGIAKSAMRHGTPAAPPCVLISGGETTVTLRGKAGRGGRNAEFLLALALAVRDCRQVAAIACDTDGIDGSEDNAGAWFDSALWERVQPEDALAALQRNDAYTLFEQAKTLIVTGPTRTNVNDFRAILIR